MRIWILVTAAIALPCAASAQESLKRLDIPSLSPPAGEWTVKYSASAEQAFTDGFDELDDLDVLDSQDEGEYGFGVKVTGAFPRYAEISFSPTLVVSPRLFDNEEEENSSLSLRVRLQRKINVTRAEVYGEGPAAGTVRDDQDQILPFLSYKFGRNYSDIFGGDTTDGHEVAFGAAYANVLGYLCKSGEMSATGCTGDAGTQYTVTFSYSAFNSENDAKDRQGPKIEFEWNRPVTNFWSLWVEASAERRSFDNLLSDDGARGADAGHYSVAGGVDLSGWLHNRVQGSANVSLKLGVRWIRTEANRADIDRNEFAIVPTISWLR